MVFASRSNDFLVVVVCAAVFRWHYIIALLDLTNVTENVDSYFDLSIIEVFAGCHQILVISSFTIGQGGFRLNQWEIY